MPSLLISLPGIPRVEIQVQDNRLRDEEERIDDRKDQEKVVNQPSGELGIGGQQHEYEQPAGQRSHAVQNHRDLGHFLGEPVISRILLSITQPFGDDDKDRSPQDKGGKQNMELRNDPDCRPIPCVGKLGDRRVRCLAISRSPKRPQKAEHDQKTALPSLHGASLPSFCSSRYLLTTTRPFSARLRSRRRKSSTSRSCRSISPSST